MRIFADNYKYLLVELNTETVVLKLNWCFACIMKNGVWRQRSSFWCMGTGSKSSAH